MSATAARNLAKMSDDELVAFVLKGLSDASAQSYRYDLDHFAKHRRANSAGAALRALAAFSFAKGKDVVAEFLRYCEREGDSGNTLNRRLNALKSSIKRLRDEGLTELVIDIKRGRAETLRDMKGPSRNVWERMLQQADDEARNAPPSYTGRRLVRDHLLLLFVGEMGLKRAPIAAMDYPDDVNLASSKVRVGGRWLDVSDRTRDAITWWIQTRGKWSGALFTREDKAHARCEPSRMVPGSITKAIRALAERAGINGVVTAQQLRNASIVRAVEDGFTAEELVAFSGNRSIDAILIHSTAERNPGPDGPIHRRRSNGPKGCPVKLRAPGAPFQVLGKIADGSFRWKPKTLKTPNQYRVLEAVADAYPGTVSAGYLRKLCGDGPQVYGRLAESDEDLRAVMRRGGFGLIDPRDPPEQEDNQ